MPGAHKVAHSSRCVDAEIWLVHRLERCLDSAGRQVHLHSMKSNCIRTQIAELMFSGGQLELIVPRKSADALGTLRGMGAR